MLAGLLHSSLSWWGGSSDYPCPGSAAYVHASARVQVQANAACDEVQAEMLSRVHSQPDKWHDPHNNGTYSTTSESLIADTLAFSRLTGDRKYTDKMIFSFADGADGKCEMLACSESQVTSILDFGTNYCNLRMLYCGSADGCKPITHDFASVEQKVSTSAGNPHDLKKCLTV